ncbi:hypothetical protein [Paraburkholderia terricola]|uniref:hypothetical protein n=1 Tax=Paraburkholderia terricola TaxID=169427 RepID=UPI0009FE87B3
MLNDLKHHRCIDLADGPSAGRRIFDGPFGHEEECAVSHTVLHSNLFDVLSEYIRAGLGIGPLPVRPSMRELRAGSMVRVLPDYSTCERDGNDLGSKMETLRY